MTRLDPTDAAGYRAGACNIGPAEIAARRRLGIIELIAAIGLAAALVVVGAPLWTRVVVWPILAGAFVTLEQVRRHFCVAFGFAGVRNFGSLGSAQRIDDATARSADRRAAAVLTAYCATAAALLTGVFIAVG